MILRGTRCIHRPVGLRLSSSTVAGTRGLPPSRGQGVASFCTTQGEQIRTRLPIQMLATTRMYRTNPSHHSITLDHHHFRPHTTNSTATASSNTAHSDVDPAPYRPPTTGFLSILPHSLLPYAELSRLDKPAGTAYLLFPCLFSTLLASCIATPIPSITSILYTSFLFTLGATTMRGAGCTINDLYDRRLDRLVERTKGRPLARDAVSVPKAVAWFGIQTLVGAVVLAQFPVNAVLLALPSMVLVMTYPLAKRVTQFPQFVLGCAFSWGAFLGFPSLGVPLVDFGLASASIWECLAHLPEAWAGLQLSTNIGDTNTVMAAGLLYTSCIAWTLLYDTVYAFQDIRDDKKAGIKSTAQAFSTKNKALPVGAELIDTRPKTVLGTLAVVQTALLCGSGYALGLSPVFFALSGGGCLATTLLMVGRVKLGDVANCAWWFKMGCWITGGAISGGLAAEFYSRREGSVERPDVGGRKEVVRPHV